MVPVTHWVPGNRGRASAKAVQGGFNGQEFFSEKMGDEGGEGDDVGFVFGDGDGAGSGAAPSSLAATEEKQEEEEGPLTEADLVFGEPGVSRSSWKVDRALRGGVRGHQRTPSPPHPPPPMATSRWTRMHCHQPCCPVLCCWLAPPPPFPQWSGRLIFKTICGPSTRTVLSWRQRGRSFPRCVAPGACVCPPLQPRLPYQA
jgi:hypothetical protein